MTAVDSPPVWSIVGIALERSKARIYADIRAYPAPIPACDQQFNYLLEQRRAINSALKKCREQDAGNAPVANSLEELGESLVGSDDLPFDALRDLTGG